MPEKRPTTSDSLSRTKSFYRTASFKMRRTVKNISRALSSKQKSWDLCHTASNVHDSDVYRQQANLEKKHREETDKLAGSLIMEREKHLNALSAAFKKTEETGCNESLLASLDEVYNSVVETSRDLASAIERLEKSSSGTRKDQLKIVESQIRKRESMHLDELSDRHEEEMRQLAAEKIYNSANEGTSEELNDYTQNFTEIDEQALQISEQDYSSFTELVRDLTAECQSELEKARSLFRWVVAVSGTSTSSELLHKFRTKEESYQRLYKKLCSYAGLRCQIIVGWSKGAGYRPNMPLNNDSFRNSWTAVSIDNTWRFVNCTWAARHVTTPSERTDVIHRYDDFYFLTDPEDHIYQHFPDNPVWQLLDNPLTIEEFTNLPVMKSAFFRYGLKLTSHCRARVTTDEIMTEIRLTSPGIFGFGSVLQSCTTGERVEGAVLQRSIADEVVFEIRPPSSGQYYLSVFVGDYWHPEYLECACSLLLDFTDLKDSEGVLPRPFPPVALYGPTPVMETLDVTSSIQDPFIKLPGNIHEINFNVSENVHITHSLEHYDSQSRKMRDCDRHAFPSSRTEESISYKIGCPRRGYYVFSLYGTDDASEPLDCLYKYLMYCDADESTAGSFPLPHSQWGKCTLHSPMQGSLLPETVYKFKLDIPNAVEVFVAYDDVVQPLFQKEESRWDGDILVKATDTGVNVMCKMNSKDSPAVFLLDYEVMKLKETTV